MNEQQQQRLDKHQQEVQYIQAYLVNIQQLEESIARGQFKMLHNRTVVDTSLFSGDDKALVDDNQAQLEREVHLRVEELALLTLRMEIKMYEAFPYRCEVVHKHFQLDAGKARWFAEKWMEISGDTYKIESQPTVAVEEGKAALVAAGALGR